MYDVQYLQNTYCICKLQATRSIHRYGYMLLHLHYMSILHFIALSILAIILFSAFPYTESFSPVPSPRLASRSSHPILNSVHSAYLLSFLLSSPLLCILHILIRDSRIITASASACVPFRRAEPSRNPTRSHVHYVISFRPFHS